MNKKLTYQQKIDLYNYMCRFMTENRKQRFDEIADKRTRYITVVLEDIFQPHNASAVLRTCDCFGVQDVHIIENKNEYNINPDVALGSSNWLTLCRYNDNKDNTTSCIQKLKKQGYSIIAATPHTKECPLEELDLSKKVAIMFGTEKDGLSESAMKQADGFIKIPMYGFTESFNISVSAALTLFSCTERLRQSEIHWQMDKEELIDIKLDWVRNSIRESKLIEKQYFQQI